MLIVLLYRNIERISFLNDFLQFIKFRRSDKIDQSFQFQTPFKPRKTILLPHLKTTISPQLMKTRCL